MKNLSLMLNTGSSNSRSHKTTAYFSGQYQKFELAAQLRQSKQSNHKTTAYFSGRYQKFESAAQLKQPKQSKPQNHTTFLWTIRKI
jgi:hypothetical protein